MLKKIRAKIEDHIIAILEKPIITNDEYMILGGYLARLEMEEAQAKAELEKGENDKRIRTLMDFMIGGGNNV